MRAWGRDQRGWRSEVCWQVRASLVSEMEVVYTLLARVPPQPAYSTRREAQNLCGVEGDSKRPSEADPAPDVRKRALSVRLVMQDTLAALPLTKGCHWQSVTASGWHSLWLLSPLQRVAQEDSASCTQSAAGPVLPAKSREHELPYCIGHRRMSTVWVACPAQLHAPCSPCTCSP